VGAIPVFMITNFLSFWHYSRKGLGIRNVLVHAVLPWAGIALCSWFIVVGLPVQMKMLLILWMAVGVFVVFLKEAVTPKWWQAEGQRKRSRATWAGLIVSLVVLGLAALGFSLWYNFYSGGILWWFVVAPYASSNIVAIAATAMFAVVFLALLWRSLVKKDVEVVK
jgi:hypothetical protein